MNYIYLTLITILTLLNNNSNAQSNTQLYSDFLTEFAIEYEIEKYLVYVGKQTNHKIRFEFDTTDLNELRYFYFTGKSGENLIDFLDTQQVWKDLLLDFNNVKSNRKSVKLDKSLPLKTKSALFPNIKINRFCKKAPMKDKPVFIFSDVVYSGSNNKAIFAVDYHYNCLAGAGMIVLMQKDDGDIWKIVLRYEYYVS